MKIVISLVWIRHKVAGGVESFTRNLLDGFTLDKRDNEYILLCSKDNVDSFRHYCNDSRFTIYEAPVITSNLRQTILFESFKLDKLVTNLGADICFVPCYRMPMLYTRNKYVVVIHDLIACHFPEKFKGYRAKWLAYASKRAAKKADKVISITNFVRNDIIERFKVSGDNIVTIYNPILPTKGLEDFKNIANDYGVKENRYFYTVSSLAYNKNLKTLVRLMALLKNDPLFADFKLVVSGVGINNDHFSKAQKELFNYIDEKGIKEKIIFTGFVSNERRNSLISNSSFFLFASIFEGFGMPVIEAMEFGAKVITTKCAALQEVSENKAFYVDDPMDESMWAEKIHMHYNTSVQLTHFPQYEIKNIASNYLNVFADLKK